MRHKDTNKSLKNNLKKVYKYYYLCRKKTNTMIKLIVAGRVGQDAELKSVGDTSVCSFSVAHTEKTFGNNPTEKTIWVTCSIWGERGIKIAPHIVKGTYVVVEGTGGVNAYMKNGEPTGVIRCMVNNIEFGGKPTPGENNPNITNKTEVGESNELPF